MKKEIDKSILHVIQEGGHIIVDDFLSYMLLIKILQEHKYYWGISKMSMTEQVFIEIDKEKLLRGESIVISLIPNFNMHGDENDTYNSANLSSIDDCENPVYYQCGARPTFKY